MNTYELHIETWDKVTNSPSGHGYVFHGHQRRVETVKGIRAARARCKELAVEKRTIVILRGPMPSMKGKIVA